jgi:hypothetical protein
MSSLNLSSGLSIGGVENRLDAFLEAEWLYYDAIPDDRRD